MLPTCLIVCQHCYLFILPSFLMLGKLPYTCPSDLHSTHSEGYLIIISPLLYIISFSLCFINTMLFYHLSFKYHASTLYCLTVATLFPCTFFFYNKTLWKTAYLLIYIFILQTHSRSHSIKRALSFQGQQ